MIDLRTGTKVWIAAGVTDMRRGFYGLSAQVQTVLNAQPYSGHCWAAVFLNHLECKSSAGLGFSQIAARACY